MICRDCEKRSKCTKICNEIEHNHLKPKYSIKSNYLVKFFDSHILETMYFKLHYEFEAIEDFNDYYTIIQRVLPNLTEKQLACVTLYYGLDDGEGYLSQIKVAKNLKISQHSVYRHLKNAKKRLRKALQS